MPPPLSALPSPMQAAGPDLARGAAGCALPSSARIGLVIGEYLLVTGVHPRADDGDGVVAGLRHGRRDHLCGARRYPIIVFGVDDPAIDARHDCVLLPAGRPDFHGGTIRVRAGPRSITVNLASRSPGSSTGPIYGTPLDS